MSITTGPRLGLMLDAAVGDAHPNEFRTFLRGVDALSQISVKSRTTAAQPSSPANGDSYILPASATGTDWGGKVAGTLAYYTTRKTTTTGGVDSTSTGWDFITPKRGFHANVEDENDAIYYFDGSSWKVFYKAGTWTPSIAGNSVAGVHTYSIRSGLYRMLGTTLLVTGRATLSAKDTAMAGDAMIIGIPSTSVFFGSLSVNGWNFTTALSTLQAYSTSGDTSITLLKNAYNAASSRVSSSDIGDTTAIQVAGLIYL